MPLATAHQCPRRNPRPCSDNGPQSTIGTIGLRPRGTPTLPSSHCFFTTSWLAQASLNGLSTNGCGLVLPDATARSNDHRSVRPEEAQQSAVSKDEGA